MEQMKGQSIGGLIGGKGGGGLKPTNIFWPILKTYF